jgi:hypothetical protein
MDDILRVSLLLIVSDNSEVVQTFATFPGISAAVKSVHLVENSVKMQQRQEEKLRPRIEDSGIDLLWNDKIDDIPDCVSGRRFILLEQAAEARP